MSVLKSGVWHRPLGLALSSVAFMWLGTGNLSADQHSALRNTAVASAWAQVAADKDSVPEPSAADPQREDGAAGAPAAANADAGGSQAPAEAGLSWLRRTEQRIDGLAGKAARVFQAVLFWEVWGRFDLTDEVKGAAYDEAAIERFAEKVREAGMDPRNVDFVVTLPPGTLSQDERNRLAAKYTELYSPLRTRSFVITEAAATVPAAGAVTKFEARRGGLPIVVVWLAFGAVFFTLRMGFINFRGFKHALHVVAGRYDNPNEEGEVTHFQALAAALSATVGLGNIAGVAIAVSVGGPGATFWMIVAGLLGMSSKFTECTLGQMYREVRPDGRVMGGAMFYLSKGLAELKLAPLGKVLAVLFAVLCIGGSLGGGNAFQVSQSLNALKETVPFLAEKGNSWIYGLVMSVLVGVVIIGGIRRIATTAEKIVPLMCGIYVAACLYILLVHLPQLPGALVTIVTGAFTPEAGYGGIIGVMVMGIRRAAFSNEAGIGSAAIAHSAARTEYPVREGIVSLLEPFVDTVVVCTMTALVIIVTGAYSDPAYADLRAATNGAGLTSNAMQHVISWFPYVLSAAVVLFAYSTMISWSYYGERCWAYLFGDRSSISYRILFLVVTFLGAIVSANNVLDLSDYLMLGMAFPNILGVLLLSNKVKRELDKYWALYKTGELPTYAEEAAPRAAVPPPEKT